MTYPGALCRAPGLFYPNHTITQVIPEEIISHYYEPGPLLEILLVHSRLVADKALECARSRNLGVDLQFVEEAAMLHDIGIFRCNAPDIECHGTLPYICHGVEGRRILEDEGLPRHALVCERHTGSGLTKAEIVSRHLPLPHRDMTPQTTEEKLICYADKFYSKSGDIRAEKPLARAIASAARFGRDSLTRFLKLHQQFG